MDDLMTSRYRLSRALRVWRLHREMKLEEVAALMDCSISKLSRMESGQHPASISSVHRLITIYGIEDEATQARLLNLAREAREAINANMRRITT